MTAKRLSLDEAIARSATVREVLIAPAALARTGALYRRQFGRQAACLIADTNTWAAAGPATQAALQDEGIATRTHVLPARPRVKPTVTLGKDLADMLAADRSIPVAVGSGVLNDLVKYAAYRLDRPYLCVATAASMDGYTSAGSPLSDRGFKKTIQCRPARAVLADLDVLAAAPAEMIGWGYADLAGKIAAGGDWIVADALEIEPIDDVAWPLVQQDLRSWLADPKSITSGKPAAIAGLFEGLSLVGLAMELHRSSRPASGADHQIAHLWEMEELSHEGERVSHGACVAIGCLSVLKLYEWLLTQDLSNLDTERIVASAADMDSKAAMIEAAFGAGEIAARAKLETQAKHLEPAAHHARLETIATGWPDLSERLRSYLMPVAQMHALLQATGAPTTADEIGVGPARHRRAIAQARFLRSRYTVLDLLDETGLLENALDAVFAEKAVQP